MASILIDWRLYCCCCIFRKIKQELGKKVLDLESDVKNGNIFCPGWPWGVWSWSCLFVPRCSCSPWPPFTLSSVPAFDHSGPGTPHKSCSFPGLVLVTLAHILELPQFFLFPTQQIWEKKFSCVVWFTSGPVTTWLWVLFIIQDMETMNTDLRMCQTI